MRLTERKPDFTQLEKVLRHEVPDRPVLFEMVGGAWIKNFAEPGIPEDWTSLASNPWIAHCHKNMGYDFTMNLGSDFRFPIPEQEKAQSVSQAHMGVVTDRESLHALKWDDPADFDYSHLENPDLPDGMKMIIRSPGGVFESVMELVGFQDLCFMLIDEPELVQEIADMVGSRMLKYFECCLPYEKVGAIFHSDDWGFKTQTMIAPDQLREFVLPWHKKIVEAVHAHGKLAILHSCGHLEAVWDEIIDDLKYDGKHSYEDGIIPIEESLDRWGDRIAMLGGIDMDYLCRKTPKEISARARALLAKTAETGGYALGSGNSIPAYVPQENFMAMNRMALEG